MVPSLDTTYISASLVREVARYGGDVERSRASDASPRRCAPRSSRRSERFSTRVRARAAAQPRRIVLPEVDDPRTLEAVARARATAESSSRCSSRPADARRTARRATAIESAIRRRALADERRAPSCSSCARPKGLTEAEAADARAHAAARRRRARRCGRRATAASPARCTPPPTCCAPRSGWSARRAGVQTVSSAFYMVVPPFRGATREVLTFTDCAVVRYPTADAARRHRDCRGARSASHRRRRAARRLLSFSTRGSGAGRVGRSRACGASPKFGDARPTSPWTENCKVTQRSSRRWRPGRRRTAPSAGGRTCWCSLRSTPGTSRTSWSSGWRRCERGRARSFRDCGGRAAISRAAPSQRTLSMWPPSPRCRRRTRRHGTERVPPGEQAHELLDQESRVRSSWWTSKAS